MNKVYTIAVPITGYEVFRVEAASPEEAIAWAEAEGHSTEDVIEASDWSNAEVIEVEEAEGA